MKAFIWEPVSGIVGPCSDISFSRSVERQLSVTMHFSLVKGLANEDLLLQFANPLALKWEDDCPGFEPQPTLLPKCTDAAWRDWTFPLLKIEDGKWLTGFQDVHQNTNAGLEISHFFLASMNDLVHLIAGQATAKWIPGLAKS